MPVLLTTACFPPGGYLAEVIRADEIVIEAYETYTKQTCRNHFTILGPNGKQTLSIPVIKVYGNHTLTKDVLISTHQSWQKIHWRSIQTAYNNSPFFLYYQDHFAHLFEKEPRFLLDFNQEILQLLLQILKISRPVRLTESYLNPHAGVTDLRTIFGSKHPRRPENHPRYAQVFESRHGFIAGLSILDILFNLGPETSFYLETIRVSQF